MGLRTLHWDDWIELDNQFLSFHALKAQRIASRGAKCSKTAPEALDAAIELLEELCAYLPERYPSLYAQTATGIDNLVTGESFDIRTRPLPEDPMQTAARLVQDDLAIMLERADGQYYLLAGSILLAGFWRLEDKFGMGMSEIHTSGDVPGFKEKLERGMGSFFRRVMPQGLVGRHNYFVQVDDGLAWSESIGGEDEEGIGWFSVRFFLPLSLLCSFFLWGSGGIGYGSAENVHRQRRTKQSRTTTSAANDKVCVGTSTPFFLLSQLPLPNTLPSLPRTGGVVFTIRTYFHPITSICAEPYVPGRLASAVRSWGDDVSRYKGKERYGDVLLEYLDRRHEEQVAAGLDVGGEEEEGRGYPF